MNPYFWFALKSVPLVGNITFRRLAEHFGSPQSVLQASEDELTRSRLVSPSIASSIRRHDYRHIAERECIALEKCGAHIIPFSSPEYPGILLEITDPPPFIYVKGNLPCSDPAVAIVGSRKGTSYGLQTTSRIAVDLAEQGITIISGMARGIDAAAHEGALKAGGKSIGVLGCGIDIVYPSENRKLFEEILTTGALISEFPIGTGPLPGNFPRRNRIISGLSRGVLVVEATEKSGSLITAQFALDQGRDVFAVPGPITSRASSGTNQLIKQGAKLVTSAEDILDEIPPGVNFPRKVHTRDITLPPTETAVSNLLIDGPMQIDEIAIKAGLTVQELSAMLLRLELQGVVIQLHGKLFALS